MTTPATHIQTDWVGGADYPLNAPAVDVNTFLETLITQEFPEYLNASGAYIQTDLEDVIYGTQSK